MYTILLCSESFFSCYFMPWIDIKFLILSILTSNYENFNINRFQGQTSFSTAPPPTCPPDKPRVYCFVDPCQVTTCPAHQKQGVSVISVEAVMQDSLMMRAMKWPSLAVSTAIQLSKLNTEIASLTSNIFCLLMVCSIRKPSLPPVFDDYLPVT